MLKTSGYVRRVPWIVWDGDIAQHHSYAVVNREIVQALMCRGFSVEILQGGACGGHQVATRGWHLAGSAGGHPVTALSGPTGGSSCPGGGPGPPPLAYVRHRWPPDFSRPNFAGSEGTRFVVIQPWEYGYLPLSWVQPIRDQVDEVWAYSEFVRQVYIQSGIDGQRVHVIGCGVNPARFRPGLKPASLPTQKGFRFLFVGGAATSRKGLDVLLSAYAGEFSHSEDVVLVVKDWFYGRVDGEISHYKARPGAPEILYIYEDFGLEELASLYAACHCYVFPFRAEGFGLTILEAMACGLPVIVTDYGPAREFCTPANSYLIPAQVRYFPGSQVGEWTTCGTPYWAEPDQLALRRLMRHVFVNREEARAKGAQAARDALSGWTWGRVASRIAARLS